MFGFGKVLDVLADGDQVRRHEWSPDLAIALVPRTEVVMSLSSDGVKVPVQLASAHLFMIEAVGDDVYVQAWAPSSADLLAQDWEVCMGGVSRGRSLHHHHS